MPAAIDHLSKFDQIGSLILEWALRILAAIAIVVAGHILANRSKKTVSRASQRANVDATLSSFFQSTAYTTVLVLSFVVALTPLGIPTTSIVAILGAAGIGVGLALQGSLSNFAAGVLLVIYRPLRLGDYIEAGGAMGTVSEIGLFGTKVITDDNKLVVVPNAKITSDKIVNYTVLAIRRIEVLYPVPADAHPLLYRDNIVRTLTSDARILSHPEPEVVFSDVTPGSITLAIRPWVKTEDYWPVYHTLQEKLLAHD